MKIELIKDQQGNYCGYKLVPENLEEQKELGTIRDLYFYGMGEDVLRYNGIETDEAETTVTKMLFIQKKYKNDGLSEILTSYQACSECGSADVQRKAWVRPNKGNEFVDYCSHSGEEGDNWCDNCEEHVKIEEREYKTQ